MMSDTEIVERISARLKELRLKQNISRQNLAVSSGVSVSSIVRMEEGEIKSFESFLRIIRTLGKDGGVPPSCTGGGTQSQRVLQIGTFKAAKDAQKGFEK